MSPIIGIYKIPDLNHVFFIVPSQDPRQEDQSVQQENKKSGEYFERILQLKDCTKPIESQPEIWKELRENDFLKKLSCYKTKEKESSNPQNNLVNNLNLLSINVIFNNFTSSQKKFNTKKILCSIPEEDVIEIFI